MARLSPAGPACQGRDQFSVECRTLRYEPWFNMIQCGTTGIYKHKTRVATLLLILFIVGHLWHVIFPRSAYIDISVSFWGVQRSNPVWIFKMLWEACCCNCYGRGRSLLLPALCGKSCSAASRLPRNGVQLLGGFRGWRMPILPKRATCFFQMKVKNFRRLSKKISRWDKDESSRLTRLTVTTGHRSHPNHPIFFCAVVACCSVQAIGLWHKTFGDSKALLSTPSWT